MNIRSRLMLVSIGVLLLPGLLVGLVYTFMLSPLRYGEIIDFDFLPPHIISSTINIVQHPEVSEEEVEEGILAVIFGDGGFIYIHSALAPLIAIGDPLSEEIISESTEKWPLEKTIGISRFHFGGESGIVFFQLSEINPIKWLRNNYLRIIVFVLVMLVFIPGILSWFFLMGIRKEFSKLISGTEKISAGTLDFQFTVPKDKALSPVFASFEDMRNQLSRSQEARNRFLMAISHDLKTPLTSIKGYIEVLEDGLAQNAEEQQEYYKILRQKSNLLEQRILELINFARMETVDWNRRFEVLPVNQFITETLSVFADEAKSRGRVLLSEVSLPDSYSINGDKEMLFRMFENLFENSFRYTEQNGTVYCYITAKSSSSLQIVIEDDGPGIPEADTSLVFEPFYRGENSRNSYGVGLGLSTVKTILTAHNGKISLKRSAYGGVCFTISIPLFHQSK